MAREEKVIIRLTEDIKVDFQNLASSLGITMSALGSFVIGKYIDEQRRQRDLQEKLIFSMAPDLVQASKEISEENRP